MSEIPDLEAIRQRWLPGPQPDVSNARLTPPELAMDFASVLAYVAQLQEVLRDVRRYSGDPRIDALLPALDEANQQGPG